MPIVFTTLKIPATAVDVCADALRRAILEGRLQPGTRLPPERRLAKDFGVNRVTVRSALARLSESGLVTVRQGSGYEVRNYLRHGGPDLIGVVADLAAEQGNLSSVVADLLLVRRQLAAALLERLCTRCSDTGKARIQDAIDRFAQAVADGAEPSELAEADVDVIAALLDATDSAVLGLCLNPITAVLRSLPSLRDAIYTSAEDNLAGWRMLLRWLDAPSHETVALIIEGLEQRDEATMARLVRRS